MTDDLLAWHHIHTSFFQAAPATPIVRLDNLSDPLATIVEIEFGNLLGELLDTVRGAAARVFCWNVFIQIERAALSPSD